MVASLFALHHQTIWCGRIVQIIFCLLILLMYLDGEHYPQCRCIFPDEILDLPCFFSPYRIEEEKDMSAEDRETIHHFPLFMHMDVPLRINRAKVTWVRESFPAQVFEKRLFSLKHYNS
ncbi:MAG: hypothetical protein ACMUIL_05925 [bacterium]